MQNHEQIIIVGAGPGGLAAAAHAHQLGVSYVLLERARHLADTIHGYQARKHVMAEPGDVPLRSELPFEAGSREAILGGWAGHVESAGLNVKLGREVTAVVPVEGAAGEGPGFRVETAAGETYHGERVVLALGTQGSPRRMGVPGEDLPHVIDRLGDAADYDEADLVVVGAGDSALEVALALAEANRVGLVVRKPAIERAKEVLAAEARRLADAGRLTIHYRATPVEIRPGEVLLATAEGERAVPADTVFVKIGATPPRRLLESFGIELSGPGREALPRLSSTYETSVPGLYLIGATSGQDLIKLAMNQGYEVVEHILGRPIEPADEELVRSRLPFWEGTAAERIAQLREEIPLFGLAGELALREAMRSVVARRYEDGEVILRQGDSTQTLVVIARGDVDILDRPDGAGGSGLGEPVAGLSAGNFFGEMGLISGRRRSASARARGQAVVLEIPRKAMLKLLRSEPAVRAEIDRAFLIRALQQYLLPEAPWELLVALAHRATVRELDRGEVLFEEGAPGDALYLIRSGMVKISKRSAGNDVVVSYLEAGNSFGETALLEGVRRTATVSAIFPTELVRLAREDCEEVLAAYPEELLELVRRLEGRRIDNLVQEATPGAGQIRHDLIEHEVVIATDALVIDNHKCVRCDNCIRACRGVHDDGQARLSLTGIELHSLLVPNSCWQCIDPKCMLDCPPDAIKRNARGEVYITDDCIGCGNCEANCPYDNIFMVYKRPTGLAGFWQRIVDAVLPERTAQGRGKAGGASQQVAVKCDLCGTVSGGPACVRSCPTGAAIRVDPLAYQQKLEEMMVRRRGEP